MARTEREVKIGGVTIGGGHPVAIQSMLCCALEDVEGNIAQARALEQAGCEIVRVTVPNAKGVKLLSALKENVSIPVVADIHYDYKMALESVAAGADKIRLNPGNLSSPEQVKQVADACAKAGVPIRVGANSGSVAADILAKYGGQPTAAALAESALAQVEMLRRFDFENVVVSIKASHVPTMVEACRLFAAQSNIPQHIGVTEAGTLRMGLVKSAVGIGSLLLDGIGSTLRVSLTADPVEEIKAAKDILLACGLRRDRVEVVSCPTCGRCKVDVLTLADKVEQMVADIRKPLTVAVMGCVVNGVGEGKQADIGIAGGDGEYLLFKKGVAIQKYPMEGILEVLKAEIESM